MDEQLKETSTRIGLLAGLGIVIRVIVTLIMSLALFLSMFLGYFTVPIFLVSVIVALYALTDIGLFLMVHRTKRSREEREAFLRAQWESDEIDITNWSGNE